MGVKDVGAWEWAEALQWWIIQGRDQPHTEAYLQEIGDKILLLQIRIIMRRKGMRTEVKDKIKEVPMWKGPFKGTSIKSLCRDEGTF